VATPPPQAPATRMVAPGWTPDFSNSILYAVRYAVGRQAASSEGQRGRLRHQVASWHADPFGEGAVVTLGETASDAVEGLVAAARVGVGEHRVHHDLDCRPRRSRPRRSPGRWAAGPQRYPPRAASRRRGVERRRLHRDRGPPVRPGTVPDAPRSRARTVDHQCQYRAAVTANMPHPTEPRRSA